MRRIAFTPLARGDLEGIWDYSAETWGTEQAERYVRQIHAVCEALCTGRSTGRDIGHVSAGCRAADSGSHVIVYRIDDRRLVVVRILHVRMDIGRHL
ncbi:toxin ParE1/3/4 [Constrictibacter sp. MBR-5]|jgi:toxin ParE1/3/4|uniref:type II toxin-antitoxin system RelE/ParE family toxin n=1 Tax=Constrictibacter sp. MBR-5 TaxID=3156467 RepID=UPI003392F02A